MSQGPETVVHRVDPVEGRENSVRLGSFELPAADRLFPFGADDPALQHVGPNVAGLLRTENCHGLVLPMIFDSRHLLWGVHAANDEFAGFAWLTQPRGTDRAGFGLVLSKDARGRGIGSLVTAGIVEVAAAPGALYRANPYMSLRIAAMDTHIHPKNVRSQDMCTGFGFTHYATARIPHSGSRAKWYQYVLPLSENPPNELTAHQAAIARAALKRASSRFEVKSVA